MHEMLQDALKMANFKDEIANPSNEHDEKPNVEAKKFYQLMKLIRNCTLIARNLVNPLSLFN